MKKWEDPDMLVLDVNMTAQGSPTTTSSDAEYDETIDGKLYHIIEYANSGYIAPSV